MWHFRPDSEVEGYGSICLLLPNIKTLMNYINTEAGRQVTFHKHLPRCVFYTSFGRESKGDQTGSHGTYRGCINNISGNDCTMAAHRERERELKTHNNQKLFLHSAAIWSCHFLFCYSLFEFGASKSRLWDCVSSRRQLVFIRKLHVVFSLMEEDHFLLIPLEFCKCDSRIWSDQVDLQGGAEA